MKVRDLIARLQEMDPELPVTAGGSPSGGMWELEPQDVSVSSVEFVRRDGRVDSNGTELGRRVHRTKHVRIGKRR